MVQLLDKATRDNINIDSAERAVIFSILHLRDAYLKSKSTSLKDSFKIITKTQNIDETIVGKITATGKIYYNSNLLTDGGSLLEAIIEKEALATSYNVDPMIVSGNIATPIEDDINIVNSLEKYLYWNCQLILIKDNFRVNEIDILPTITSKLAENSIEIAVNLDFNFNHYLKTNNLIESIGIIDNIDVQPNEEISSFSGNDSFFGNDVFLGN